MGASEVAVGIGVRTWEQQYEPLTQQAHLQREVRVGLKREAGSREGFAVTGAPLGTGTRKVIV